MRSTRIKERVICTQLLPNLNLPIFLFRPLGTKPPNLDRQYFRLYGMPDTNDHPQRGIYSVAIILGQQHYRREIWATFLHIVLVVWVMYSIYNQRTTSPLKIQCRPRCYAKSPTAQAIPVSSAALGWPGDWACTCTVYTCTCLLWLVEKLHCLMAAK